MLGQVLKGQIQLVSLLQEQVQVLRAYFLLRQVVLLLQASPLLVLLLWVLPLQVSPPLVLFLWEQPLLAFPQLVLPQQELPQQELPLQGWLQPVWPLLVRVLLAQIQQLSLIHI